MRICHTSADFLEGLSRGERVFGLAQGNCVFEEPVDLDYFNAADSLRIAGCGIDLSNINRTGDFPLFRARRPWHFDWSRFTAQNGAASWTEPLFDFSNVDSSLFHRVAVRNGRDAWKLGVGGQCSTSAWVDCAGLDNVNAWYIENGINLHFVRPKVERNKNAGIYWKGPNKASRGIGSITDGHFEQHGESPTPSNWGVFLENVNDVRIDGNFLYLSDLYAHSDCQNIVTRRNTRRESRILGVINQSLIDYDANVIRDEGEW